MLCLLYNTAELVQEFGSSQRYSSIIANVGSLESTGYTVAAFESTFPPLEDALMII
jgi:hypothetical protein